MSEIIKKVDIKQIENKISEALTELSGEKMRVKIKAIHFNYRQDEDPADKSSKMELTFWHNPYAEFK